MVNDAKREKIAQMLKGYGQEHLLAFYDQLNQGQKQRLCQQIEALDFSRIPGWIEKYVLKNDPPELPAHFGPAQSYSAVAAETDEQNKYSTARQKGVELLGDGKVAAFVVAGGQGTRLGFDGPKGDYPISPIKNKTLFRLFAESLLAAGNKYGFEPIWYIMTSPLNHDETVKIFESNDYYGLAGSNVFIFQQGTLPNFSRDGKILLAGKSTVATSPDGHGGSLKALHDSGALKDMKNRGIEYISYFQVDNPLVNVTDPLFIGLHAMDEAQMSSKALIKANPTEKVGNFCIAGGRVMVIEYSDLPDEHAHQRKPDGSLVFELGSIAIHIINRSFVEELNDGEFSLPIHRADKKIAHIDTNGQQVAPKEPNGIKLETFVFDALALAERSIILETIRSQEFAPVKNAAGTDSAEVTKHMISQRGANWLQTAGIYVPKKPDGSPDCVIEIAPSFALCPEDVQTKKNQIQTIEPGEWLYLQ